MHRLLAFFFLAIVSLTACDSSQPEQPKTSEASKQAIQQLGVAVALNNKATQFKNQFPSFERVSAADMTRLKSLWVSALIEAREIDIDALNADTLGFGDAFSDKFIKGLELCVDGNGQMDIVQGQLLLDAFGQNLSAVKAQKRASAR